MSPGSPNRRAEAAAILLLLATAGCAAAFVVLYAMDGLRHQTQLLGLALGLAFACLAGCLLIVAKLLVTTEELEEDYPEEDREEQEALTRVLAEGASRITRKRLFGAAAAAAGGALGAALITPAAGLGPVLDTSSLYETPWRRGRRLVDDRGRPLRADDVEAGAFYTAYPEGAEVNEIGAPVVLVRVDPSRLALPPERAGWAPEGIVAYSKVCTHAGCAIAMYRKPLFAPVQPRAALVCPCHYSTFDPAAAGAVLFGPAGRPLPQLPLLIDPTRELRAAGNFSGPVGPAWWGVRKGRPT